MVIQREVSTQWVVAIQREMAIRRESKGQSQFFFIMITSEGEKPSNKQRPTPQYWQTLLKKFKRYLKKCP